MRALIPLDLEDEFDPRAPISAGVRVARDCRAELEVFILGRKPDEQIAQEALAMGAHRVWLVAHPSLPEQCSAAQAAAALVETLSLPEITDGVTDGTKAFFTLLPPCTAGEEVAARLAVELDGAALGRCLRIELAAGGLRVTRATFGGRAEATLVCKGAGFAVMRIAGSVSNSSADPRGELRRLRLSGSVPPGPRISRTQTAAGQRRLEGAKLVVSGGRGIGGPEGFVLLQQLAQMLGGALGGSLPTVDAGWVPVSRQVGQSGKFVTPAVYVAVGISGTPQHLAGIGPDTRIVAINSDPDAAIFQVAELGCVGDWRQVLPQIIKQLSGSDGNPGS